MLEQRKHQFFGFVIILLLIGFLNYYRKIINGLKLSQIGKILYLATMILFIVSVMFLLYFTEANNITSFIVGLSITVLSEHIAKLFLIVGDNFNVIVSKIFKSYFKINLDDELIDKKQKSKKQ